MKALLLLCTLASLSTNATSIHFGGWSKHKAKGLNETHQLYAIEHRNVIAGTFINSYNNRGYIAGYNWKASAKYFDYGVVLGGVTGYNKGEIKAVDCSNLCPLVIPYISTKNWPVNLQLGFNGDMALLSARLDF